jgi:hypothetical protein
MNCQGTSSTVASRQRSQGQATSLARQQREIDWLRHEVLKHR